MALEVHGAVIGISKAALFGLDASTASSLKCKLRTTAFFLALAEDFVLGVFSAFCWVSWCAPRFVIGKFQDCCWVSDCSWVPDCAWVPVEFIPLCVPARVLITAGVKLAFFKYFFLMAELCLGV